MEEERNIVARAKIMDIISITAVVGAITGCASLCWNIITYTGFNLGIYSYFLAFKRADAILHKEFLMTLGHIKNINNYSDDAITLNGWFTLLLRKEGQRFNNHHVDGFSLVMSKALKDALSNILAEPPSYIPLFPSSETKDLRLLEGAPTEVKFHSNVLFLKKGWKDLTDFRLDEVIKNLNDLIEKDKNKIYIQLTTYKYPLCYEKKGGWFHREFLWKRAINAVRWHIKV